MAGTLAAAVAGVLVPAATELQAGTAVTWNGGSGDWGTAASWSGAVVPDNGTERYDVFIDGGKTGVASAVQLNVHAVVDTLALDEFDALNFSGGRVLRVEGGSILNNGSLNVNASGLFYVGDTTLEGSGVTTLIKHGGSAGVIAPFNPAFRLTNGPSHTIRGAGILGGGGNPFMGITMTNLGGIEAVAPADAPDRFMYVLPTTTPGGGFTNRGTMQAQLDGGLWLEPGTYDNVGGVIESFAGIGGSPWVIIEGGAQISGGTLQASGNGAARLWVLPGASISGAAINARDGAILEVREGATVTGGTFQTSGGGVNRIVDVAANPSGRATLGDVTNRGRLELGKPHDLTNAAVPAEATLAGTITNDGTFTFTATGTGAQQTLQVGGNVALLGNGVLQMVSGSRNAIGPVGGGADLLTNGPGHTIAGTGAIVTVPLNNQGRIRATPFGTSTSMSLASSSLINTGTMEAAGGALLRLGGTSSGAYHNDGVIETADAQSRVSVTNTWTGNGHWLASAGGPMTFEHGANVSTGGNVAVGNGGVVRLQPGATLAAAGIILESTGATLELNGGRVTSAIASHGNATIRSNGINSGIAGASGDGRLLVDPRASLAADHVRMSQIEVGGTLAMRPGGGTSRAKELLVDGAPGAWTGRIDLNDNNLIVDYANQSPIATWQSLIQSGHAGGNWTGNGLASTAADSDAHGLGYAESSEVFSSFPATFAGQAVDDTVVLVAFTRYGDADLDGAVTLTDFNRLASAFGATHKRWSDGDFNYDGAVNLQDFNLLAANFGLSASGPGVTPGDWAALGAAVPEPAGAMLGAITAIGLLRRQRRAAMG